MNAPLQFGPAVRRWVAAAGVAGVMGSAAWYGLAEHPAAATAQPDTRASVSSTVPVRDSYADVVQRIAPAVVTVRVDGHARISPTQYQLPDDLFEQFFGGRGRAVPRELPRQRTRALGSGVVVSGDGYILTNNHVVDGADTVTVEFTDGRTLDAKIIGTDKPSDLALLKVSATQLPAAVLGDSDNVKVGDVVLAVGNPLNVGQTVTMGIISAKGRSTGIGDGSYEDFLQTDAPINHGNSGGALVNTRGELIGINSQILSNSDGNIGIGFAIPANMARRVMTDLKTDGKVTRAQLGVTVQTVSPEMAASLGLKQQGGVIVSSVAKGSAAERAGIERGDVIKALDDQPVNDMNALRNRIAESEPGSTANLVVIRDGSEKSISVKLDALDSGRVASAAGDDEGEADKTALGIRVAPLTPDLASELRLPRDVKGVVVQSVDPEGRAADAGVRAGDVIQEVNQRAVDSVDALRAAVRDSGSKPTLLLVHRDGADLFVAVKPANG